MNNENSIHIRGVSKVYKIYPSLKERLVEWLSPFPCQRHEDKWVLKNVNLEVRPGEAVGIIGMNGAGKSTLLKIITGTTIPTSGSVEFHGSVAALLELGLGFHPDFTGRQNVYMSGQLLGYSIAEIDACMKDVEAFAEIGKAVDAPVRTYSSGMQVRLAFSVATMKRPDILIVDEALSVGDSYFQHKSFNRIKSFCDAGTTLLLVSHDPGAIQAVCDRAVLMDRGRIIKVGEPPEVMDYYNAMIGGQTDREDIRQERREDGKVQTISGNGAAKILSVRLLNDRDIEPEVVAVGEHVRIVVEVEIEKDIEDLTCGIMIRNRLGEAAFGTNSYLCDKNLSDVHAGEKARFTFSLVLNLGEGNYSITVALHSGRDHVDQNYEWRDLAVVFEMVNQSKNQFVGMAYLETAIDIKRY